MSQAAAAPADGGALPVKDRIIIALIAAFTLAAFTLEAYWLWFNQVMESRTDVLARALALYWPADYTYRVSGYGIEKCFTLAVEGVNVLVTPLLSLLLVRAILRRKPYRYPLQLTIAAFTFYGTFLYYLVAHLSGYAVFADKTISTYLLFYLASLPWLLAYGWMGADAFRAIAREYAATELG
jgi:hypothetical protein